MHAASAIVVVIDGLGARYLGPYGNTWIETPTFNRLAAESFLCEQCYADSPDLAVVYRSFWSGLHAASGLQSPPWLSQRLFQKGLPATLLTDDASLAEHPGAQDFAERIVVGHSAAESLSRQATAEDDISTTRFARLFAQAIDFLERSPGPFFLWIHSQGMRELWDAPQSLREQFRAEDDPPAMLGATPPQGRSTRAYDPDELLPWAQAYAAQVTLLDLCLEPYLDAVLAASRAAPLVHLLAAPRGFPLGEHNVVGLEGCSLYEELLHVPLMVHFPGGAGAAQRTQALVHPADVNATLLDLLDTLESEHPARCGASLAPLVENESAPWRHCLVSMANGGSEKTVRTRYWSLVRTACQAASSRPESGDELYLKPDDRCDANEIASRRSQVVEDMRILLDEAVRAFEQGGEAVIASTDRPALEPPSG